MKDVVILVLYLKDDGWVVVRGMLEGGGNLVVKRTGTMRSKGFQWSIRKKTNKYIQTNILKPSKTECLIFFIKC